MNTCTERERELGGIPTVDWNSVGEVPTVDGQEGSFLVKGREEG